MMWQSTSSRNNCDFQSLCHKFSLSTTIYHSAIFRPEEYLLAQGQLCHRYIYRSCNLQGYIHICPELDMQHGESKVYINIHPSFAVLSETRRGTVGTICFTLPTTDLYVYRTGCSPLVHVDGENLALPPFPFPHLPFKSLPCRLHVRLFSTRRNFACGAEFFIVMRKIKKKFHSASKITPGGK